MKIILTRIFNFVTTIVEKEIFENETENSTTFLFSFQRSWSMMSSTIKTYLKILKILKFTLVDYLDTTEEELKEKQHVPGPSCRCSVCMKLKLLEDKFILKSGSFYSQGLNTRDEVKNRSRVQWN